MKKTLFVFIMLMTSLSAFAQTSRWILLTHIELGGRTKFVKTWVKIKASDVRDTFHCKYDEGGKDFDFHYGPESWVGLDEVDNHPDHFGKVHAMPDWFVIDYMSIYGDSVKMSGSRNFERELNEIPEVRRDGIEVNGFVCSI